MKAPARVAVVARMIRGMRFDKLNADPGRKKAPPGDAEE
jgi:hypothetical protein